MIYAFLQPEDGGIFLKLARTRVMKRLGNNSVKQKTDAARDRDLKSFTDGFLVTADDEHSFIHNVAWHPPWLVFGRRFQHSRFDSATYNKQIMLVLLDLFLREAFPEDIRTA
eukprot:gene17352-9613_t